MRRSEPVTRGTDEHSAMPSMSLSSQVKPWKPRNSWSTRACSSAVRSTLVAIRQWSTSDGVGQAPLDVGVVGLEVVEADHGLGVADVEGEEHGA